MNRFARSRSSRRDDQGMVTAEAAMVLPVLLLVLGLMITVVVTLSAKIKILDASREAARLAARGEGTSAAVAAGERLGPAHTTVEIRDRAHWVEAVVHAQIRPFSRLPGFTVTATTLAEREEP